MIMQKNNPTRIAVLDVAELRELQAAANQRVDALKKLEKKCLDEYAPVAAMDVRRKLAAWTGNDSEPGLMERIQDQVSFFEPAFDEPEMYTPGQRTIFDEAETEAEAAPVDTDPNPGVHDYGGTEWGAAFMDEDSDEDSASQRLLGTGDVQDGEFEVVDEDDWDEGPDAWREDEPAADEGPRFSVEGARKPVRIRDRDWTVVVGVEEGLGKTEALVIAGAWNKGLAVSLAGVDYPVPEAAEHAE